MRSLALENDIKNPSQSHASNGIRKRRSGAACSPNGVIPPPSRLPLGRGSMHYSATRLVTSYASSLYLLLATIAAAFFCGGCSHGAHADAVQKPKPREPETLKAAVHVVEPANWPTIVRTQ